MPAYECFSRGAPVPFVSAATVFAVCSHDRSMDARRDQKLESIGLMAVLFLDTGPRPLGTRERWREKGRP